MIYWVIIMGVVFLKFLQFLFRKAKKESFQRKIKALEGANMILAKEIFETERELENLKKSTVCKKQYQQLQRECELLTKYIKQHIENI